MAPSTVRNSTHSRSNSRSNSRNSKCGVKKATTTADRQGSTFGGKLTRSMARASSLRGDGHGAQFYELEAHIAARGRVKKEDSPEDRVMRCDSVRNSTSISESSSGSTRANNRIGGGYIPETPPSPRNNITAKRKFDDSDDSELNPLPSTLLPPKEKQLMSLPSTGSRPLSDDPSPRKKQRRSSRPSSSPPSDTSSQRKRQLPSLRSRKSSPRRHSSASSFNVFVDSENIPPPPDAQNPLPSHFSSPPPLEPSPTPPPPLRPLPRHALSEMVSGQIELGGLLRAAQDEGMLPSNIPTTHESPTPPSIFERVRHILTKLEQVAAEFPAEAAEIAAKVEIARLELMPSIEKTPIPEIWECPTPRDCRCQVWDINLPTQRVKRCKVWSLMKLSKDNISKPT